MHRMRVDIGRGRAFGRRAVAVMALVAAMGGLGFATRPAAAQSPCPATSPIQLTPVMPSIFLSSGVQIGADCLAWQEFIYLNWQANPTARGYPNPNAPPTTFGTAGDVTPKVWESYDEAGAVFALPDSAAARAGAPGLKPLFHLSELGDVELRSIGQAGNGKWITTQSGGLTYYEVRLNLDEVAFIKGNVFSGSDLTTFAGQAACAVAAQPSGMGGFNLPQGGSADTDCTGKAATYGANLGAIELKASWVVLPADHSLDYRYLTAKAQIIDPYGNKSTATVGLVGLHIIHKVQGAAQFLWATFEQIDNDPDYNNGNPQPPVLPPNPNQKPGPGYTFFNPNCSPNSDPYYHCVPNTLPGPACTTPPPNPQPPGCFPYSAPTPIARVYAVDSTANSATGYAWSLLPAASVFNYYRLIEVQWPNASSPVPPQSRTPLSGGNITPSSQTLITANTTAETYVQTTKSCMDCHQNAPIAQQSTQQFVPFAAGHTERHVILSAAPAGAGAAPYASDYSFVFVEETTR
jgi:hypothetical protein